MVDNEHQAEDLVELLRFVVVLLALEERNEHIKLPVVIESPFFLVDLKYL